MDNYISKIKFFLDSGTTEAKATKIALSVVAVAGALGISFLAAGMGNAVQVFSMFKKSKRYSKAQIKGAFENLKNQKLIEYVSDKNGMITVSITTKGKLKLRSFAIDVMAIEKPKRWDGKWRIVMFDLPVRFSKARNSLRLKLKQLGFVQFQKSVWLYPYLCEHEILFVADHYKVGKYVEILEVTRILNDMKFRKSFGL